MRFRKAVITSVLAMILFAGAFVADTAAQGRVTVVRRPVIVRQVVYRDPFWSYRYYRDPYYRALYDPYYRYYEERRYLESRLRGDRNELAKHRAKYMRDRVLTAKEREELADDIRDVRRSTAALNRFNRRY